MTDIVSDMEQRQRERAYKIWEDEGRPDGAHEDHWKRAQMPESQGRDVTEANREANEEFAGEDGRPRDNAAEIRPPSTVAPD